MAVVERLIEGLEICVSVLDERIRESPPDYATIGSAGLDLRACIDQPLVLLPGAAALLPTGLAVYIGHPGYAGMVLPRSGLGAVHGLVLGNLVGLIDPDYQGPLKLSCWNRGAESYTIRPMERVAQMILLPFVKAKLNWVDDFSPTARGVGGFGSTGVD